MSEWQTIKRSDELPVASDLCEAAIDRAMEFLPESKAASFFGLTDVVTLSVASQSVGEAMLLSLKKTNDGRGISVRLNCEYNPDEWSVETLRCDFDRKIVTYYAVHSPDA